VDFIIEQISGAGQVSAKKIFGEYGLLSDRKMVALICDDRLIIKSTAAARSFIGEVVEAQPYPGARACFLISGKKWDDRECMNNLIRISAKNLP
jgi:TfoX/Sxy family transcriptional regulator of competence genes